jgi:hypothetical protein
VAADSDIWAEFIKTSEIEVPKLPMGAAAQFIYTG